MIAVDHHPRALRPGKRGQIVDAIEYPPAGEQCLADKDQVGVAATGGGKEALGKIAKRLGVDEGQHDLARFDPARHLAPCRVEFAAAHQYAQRPVGGARAGRGEADQEIMGIGREDNRRAVAAAKLGCDVRLCFGPHFAHHPVPLVVGEPRGVVPTLHLAVEAGIGPQMVAVRGHVQPPWRGGERLRETMA